MAFPCPEFEFIEEMDYGQIMADAAFGVALSGTTRQQAYRVFHLNWARASKADRDSLVSEYNTALGAAGEVSFTPSHEATATTCRFADEPLKHEWLTQGIYSMSCRLLETQPLV